MPGAMQFTKSQQGKALLLGFVALAAAIIVGAILKAQIGIDSKRAQEEREKHQTVIDALKSAEERSLVVFKDGEMGYVTRAGLYGHLEVKERCSMRFVPAPTRTPSFLERIEKVVRVDDPNYQELRIEYIARCFLTHGR